MYILTKFLFEELQIVRGNVSDAWPAGKETQGDQAWSTGCNKLME